MRVPYINQLLREFSLIKEIKLPSNQSLMHHIYGSVNHSLVHLYHTDRNGLALVSEPRSELSIVHVVYVHVSAHTHSSL